MTLTKYQNFLKLHFCIKLFQKEKQSLQKWKSFYLELEKPLSTDQLEWNYLNNYFHFPLQKSNFDGTTVYPHSGQLFAVMIPYLTVFYLYTTTKVRTEAKFEGKNNWLLFIELLLFTSKAFREKENMLLLVSKSRNINDINILFQIV